MLILLVAATGCQLSDSGDSSLKANQIVFDAEYSVSAFVEETEIAAGMLKNNGAGIAFTVTEPSMAKGLTYQNINGMLNISLDDLTLDVPQALLSEYSWFMQLANILQYVAKQPQNLEEQGQGNFSGSTENGTTFTIKVRNKGSIEKITVNQFSILFS